MVGNTKIAKIIKERFAGENTKYLSKE